MTRLIGIGGRLRSGKDAIADHLVEKHGFVKLGMSDPLLDAALVLNPIVGQWDGDTDIQNLSELVDAVGYVEAKKNPEVRRFLQALGTDFGRDMIGEDVWVDIAQRSIHDLFLAGKDVVITGLRFANEVEMIGQAGGRTWWVNRYDDGITHSESSAAKHASENGVDADDFDTVVRNNGTLDDLYAKVDRLVA